MWASGRAVDDVPARESCPEAVPDPGALPPRTRFGRGSAPRPPPERTPGTAPSRPGPLGPVHGEGSCSQPHGLPDGGLGKGATDPVVSSFPPKTADGRVRRRSAPAVQRPIGGRSSRGGVGVPAAAQNPPITGSPIGSRNYSPGAGRRVRPTGGVAGGRPTDRPPRHSASEQAIEEARMSLAGHRQRPGRG